MTRQTAPQKVRKQMACKEEPSRVELLAAIQVSRTALERKIETDSIELKLLQTELRKEELYRYLSEIDLLHLTAEQRQLLDNPLELEEFKTALAKLPHSKVLGADRIPQICTRRCLSQHWRGSWKFFWRRDKKGSCLKLTTIIKRRGEDDDANLEGYRNGNHEVGLSPLSGLAEDSDKSMNGRRVQSMDAERVTAFGRKISRLKNL
ncbi:hypothetical protein NDU88_003995 [Pleurodeles waltl]|uniref:Uncharacterized protein n=1 Tax=Pleurodeles waltl TaxID=8319 RepID=A0AAV7L7D2_PLEWA|nr:hypothetical protein NDU88_003995 [Pleurodeles waltl]